MSGSEGAVAGPSELQKRVVAGAAMAGLAIGADVIGGWAFAAFWILASMGLAYEWQSLLGGDRRGPRTGLAIAGVVLAGMGASTGSLLVVLAGLALAVAPGALAPDEKRVDAAIGGLYAALPVVAVIACRGEGSIGMVAILWLFAIVWGTDVMAYFTGRAIGGPKLWPAISPKKTWSGAIGGLTSAVVLASAVLWISGYAVGLWHIALAAVLSIAAQAGDFYESAIKRRYGAKDSSHLIPGHGGVMDRLDGFIFATVLASVIGGLRGGWGNVPAGLIG